MPGGSRPVWLPRPVTVERDVVPEDPGPTTHRRILRTAQGIPTIAPQHGTTSNAEISNATRHQVTATSERADAFVPECEYVE